MYCLFNVFFSNKNSASHQTDQYICHRSSTENIFLDYIDKDKDFKPLRKILPQVGGFRGNKCRKFYNILARPKSPAKKILNKFRLSYSLKSFETCKKGKSKQLYKNIEQSFQPNYCTMILITLFFVFKVRQFHLTQ